MLRTLAYGTAAALGVMFLTACATGQRTDQPPYSGFLSNYSQLEQARDASGEPVLRYLSPKLSSGAYHGLYIEPVVFYPARRPDEQVTVETLSEIRDYFDRALRERIGASVNLADAPGLGIVRMRVAITNVATERAGLHVLPIRLVVEGAQEAAGTRARESAVYAELELMDSVTGEWLGGGVKGGSGQKVKAGAHGKLTLDHVQPVLDRWAQAAANLAAAVRKQ